MNPSTVSEEFGQRMEMLTAGTKYEIDPEGGTSIPDTEYRIRAVMYNLWMDAHSNMLAYYLEKNQVAHFEQLYEFSYGVQKYDLEEPISSRTDSLALRIIAEKERYKKRIQYLKHKHKQFRAICNQLKDSDCDLLINYFEHHGKVDYVVLRDCLKRNLKLLEKHYETIEREKDSKAIKDSRGFSVEMARDYHKQHEGKKQYLIRGHFEYMTEEEYMAYQENEEKKKQLSLEQWRKYMYDRCEMS